MQAVGIALLSLTMASVLILRFTPIDDEALRWVARLVPPVTLVLGAFLLYRGKQRAAQAAARMVFDESDHRPPIVYLRPFTKDESLAGQVFTAVLTSKVLSGFASEEEQLAEAVAPIGPLLAIGQPGERLPKPGAIRAYATDAEWKDVVIHWLTVARLIILRPGTSQGVWWEMEQVVRATSADRFLMLLIRATRPEYDALARMMQERFTISLPDFQEIQRARVVTGFFEFAGDWRARFLPLQAPTWRRSSYKSMRTLFHYALRPVFERLGTNWRPMPVSALSIAAAGMLGMLLLFFGAMGVVMLTALMKDEAGYVEPVASEEPIAADTPPTAPAVEWVPWSVVGLDVMLPAATEPEKNQVSMTPPADQPAVETFERYQITSNVLVVSVSRVVYKPGIELSLDGAVQGSLKAMATDPDVSDLRSSSTNALVSGQPAVRTRAFYTNEERQQLRMESLTFAAGQTLWQVIAVVPETDRAEDTVNGILGSVTRH